MYQILFENQKFVISDVFTHIHLMYHDNIFSISCLFCFDILIFTVFYFRYKNLTMQLGNYIVKTSGMCIYLSPQHCYTFLSLKLVEVTFLVQMFTALP